MGQLTNFDTDFTFMENLLFMICRAIAVKNGRFVPRTIAESKTLFTDVWSNFSAEDYAALDSAIGDGVWSFGSGALTLAAIKTDAAAQVGVNGYVKPAANVATVATANATDLATTEALANQLKVSFNLLLGALKQAHIVTPD